MKRFLAGLLLLFVTTFAFGVGDTQPIRPQFQGTVTISCTTSSAATALATIAAVQAQVQLEVTNAGTGVIFLETGSSLVASVVASGYPILAGQTKIITVGPRVTHIACISGSGTHTLYVSVGQGN